MVLKGRQGKKNPEKSTEKKQRDLKKARKMECYLSQEKRMLKAKLWSRELYLLKSDTG